MQSPNPLINELTEGLQPVHALRVRSGLAWSFLALSATIIFVALTKGLWMQGLTGGASPFFYIGNGLLLVLSIAATCGTLSLANPRVGYRQDGPRWALATVAVLPVTALIALFASPSWSSPLADPFAFNCFSAGMGCSLFVAAALVLWLRRGAPVSINAAGWLIGVSAAAAGAFAHGLACPVDSVLHIGIWHTAPVAAGAIIGRLVLPPILRW